MTRSSRPMRPLVRLCVLAAVPLSVVACSSSSDSATSTAPAAKVTTTVEAASPSTEVDAGGSSLSADEFVTQANAICAAGNAEIESLFSSVPAGTEPSAEQQQTLKDSLLDSVSQQVDDIAMLGVPTDLQSEVQPFLDQARTTIEQSRTQSPQEFFAAGNPFAELNTAAIAAGLTTCGA